MYFAERSTKIISMRLLLLFAAILFGCSEVSEKEEKAFEFLQRFLQALDQADGLTLWEIADDETHVYFEDLAKEIKETLGLIDKYYPEKEKALARKGVGGDFVHENTDGKKLFLALLDQKKLAGPSDPDARKPKRAFEIEKGTITVFMESGDTLDFVVDEKGNLRVKIFRIAFEELPAIKTLRDNFQIVKKSVEVLTEQKLPAKKPPAKVKTVFE